MEKTKIIVLLVLCFNCILSQKLQSGSIVANAIHGILLDSFAVKPWAVNLVYFGKKSGKSEKLTNEILRNNVELIDFQVTKGRATDKLNTSSILLFDSVQTFKLIYQHISWNTTLAGSERYPYLVYVPETSTADLSENIADGFSVDTVGFLINDTNKSIDLCPRSCTRLANADPISL